MELIFCYNARSGLTNGLIDLVHKTISPSTYKCNLCFITYTYKRRDLWKKFIEEFHIKISFIYKEHLHSLKLSKYDNQLPCCFLKEKGEYKVIITKEELNLYSNEKELIDAISRLEDIK